jgi:hypothetical protein
MAAPPPSERFSAVKCACSSEFALPWIVETALFSLKIRKPRDTAMPGE